MNWPTEPLPTQVRAILLLPAGIRAADDGVVPFPAPRQITGARGGVYALMQLHGAGECDMHTRELYVLGGRFTPYGYRLEVDDVTAPEEIRDDD